MFIQLRNTIVIVSILAMILTFPVIASKRIQDENIFMSPNVQRAPAGERERFRRIAPEPPEVRVGVNVMQQPIDYSYGFNADKANFVQGEYLHTSGVTKDWLVLVNIHTEMPLNTTNVFDPTKRTLKWGSPFENARVNLFKIGDPHQQSALVRDWTQGKHRKNVSFVFIPPNTEIEYLIGYASPQQSQNFDYQAGGGMQMRLKNLPAGTIVLDTKLVTEQQLGKAAGQKSFSLDKILNKAIRAYNRNHQNAPLPPSLADPNHYPYDISDIREVNEHHLKL